MVDQEVGLPGVAMGGTPAASLVYVAAGFFGLLGRGGAVNVDLGSAITYAGPGGSEFGFAVSLLANRTAAYVLAGAPKGAPPPPLAQNGSGFGALYRCVANSGAAKAAVGACSSLPVDVSGIGKAFDGASRSSQPVETKAGQLLGMAIASAPSGAVIACAPHYLFNGQSGTMATRRRDPTGNCFLTPDVGRYNFTEYSPCRRQLELYMASPNWIPGVHDDYPAIQTTGNGMCGFSVASASGAGGLGGQGPGGYLFAVGAPGSFYWLGQLYTKTNEASGDKFTDSSSLGSSRGEDYLGYAIAVGRFSRNSTSSHVVSSAPRANATRGELVVFSSSWLNLPLAYVSGDQPGSYLGYSLAVADVDGDGVDDIVAGAPMWTDYGADKVEAGAVYVYRWLSESLDPLTSRLVPKFSPCVAVRGQTARSRFGSVVVAAGDLNLDGAADVAVGAPYGGPDGRGAVYIYRGTRGGCLREPHSQLILASDVVAVASSPPPLTFGWSLAGGVDVDGNGYADLAVGAYKSSSAYLLRSRPIIGTTVSVATQPAAAVRLGGDCAAEEGTSSDGGDEAASPSSPPTLAASVAAEFSVRVCVDFTPAGGLSEPRSATFRATIALDADQPPSSGRAFFRPGGLPAASLELTSPGPGRCGELRAYVPRGARDKVSPIAVSVSHALLNTSLSGGSSVGGSLEAVVDGFQANATRTLVAIEKNCSSGGGGRSDDEGACRPRLALAAVPGRPYYVAGAGESVLLSVVVSNAGDDAYATYVAITLPAGVSYVNAHSVAACPPIVCSQDLPAAADDEPTRVTCDVGNPLPSGRTANFTLRTRVGDASRLRSAELAYSVTAASAFGNRTTRVSVVAVVTLRAAATLYVTGASLPDADVTYNDTQVAAGGPGPAVSHRYEAFTEGPTDIDEAELVILWPATLHGNGSDHLLYLLRPPLVASGNGTCSVTPSAAVAGDPAVVGRSAGATTARDSYACGGGGSEAAHGGEGEATTCTLIVCRLFSLRRTAAPSVVIIDAALWLGPTFARLTSGHSRRATVYSVVRGRALRYPLGMLDVDGGGGSSSDGATASGQPLRVGSYFDKYRLPTPVAPLDWKWIVIGAGGGLLLLVVIVLIFWRCGFFKRNRPPTLSGITEKETALLGSGDEEAEAEAAAAT